MKSQWSWNWIFLVLYFESTDCTEDEYDFWFISLKNERKRREINEEKTESSEDAYNPLEHWYSKILFRRASSHWEAEWQKNKRKDLQKRTYIFYKNLNFYGSYTSVKRIIHSSSLATTIDSTIIKCVYTR